MEEAVRLKSRPASGVVRYLPSGERSAWNRPRSQTFVRGPLPRAKPGDVEGLRYQLGHVSGDAYRVYAGQAGAIIAQHVGRTSLSEDWLPDDELDDSAPQPAATRASPTPELPVARVTPLQRQRSRALHPPDEAPEAAELIAAAQAYPVLARALLQALRGVA